MYLRPVCFALTCPSPLPHSCYWTLSNIHFHAKSRLRKISFIFTSSSFMFCWNRQIFANAWQKTTTNLCVLAKYICRILNRTDFVLHLYLTPCFFKEEFTKNTRRLFCLGVAEIAQRSKVFKAEEIEGKWVSGKVYIHVRQWWEQTGCCHCEQL